MCKQIATFAITATIAFLIFPLSLDANSAAGDPPSPDFNGDGTVNVHDFLLFIPKYGSSRGDANYDAKYDLDSNDRIGISDFLIFVNNFGSQVPSSDGDSNDGNNDNDIISTEKKKDRIVEILFGLNLGEADSMTYHDYNDYKNCPTGKFQFKDGFREFNCDKTTGDPGYRGGHSGWDVQTKSVAGDANTADEPFYSLTPGEVIATGGTLGKIAVYYAPDDKTIIYLHARRIDVTTGRTINVRNPLGIQGNVGLGFSDPSKSEHVHIEVRDGRTTFASLGADPSYNNPTIDPVDYLYSVLVENGLAQ